MTGEKNVANTEPVAPVLSSDSSSELSGKDMVPGKDETLSVSASFASSIDDATSAIKGLVIDQTSGSEQGYNGNVSQPNDKGYSNTTGGSYKGTRSDNGSILYYMPGGYGPYASDAFSCYTYDSTFAGNGSAAKSGTMKPMTRPSGSGKLNSFSSTKNNNDNISSKSSSLGYNPRGQQPSSKFSKSLHPTQPPKPFNKTGYGSHSTALPNGFHQPVGKFSSFNTDGLVHYSPVNYQSTSRVWNNNYRYNNNYGYNSREKISKNGNFETSTELTRGPRANNKNNSPQLSAEQQTGLAFPREKYNLEFQIHYDKAKFYVIKSYSEDDVHKCIKYDVWSSTPNGNKKLDAAFRDASAISSESGVKCPVFLFFSVNASGQFIGIGEMIGQVDFNKNMDFWQVDKWNGFFPVKWHIIKDVPNVQLNHITLENNDNRSVTYTRDTHEIGLKQGLEMLSIFKNYSEKTSILQDFNFYETREKLLRVKRDAKLALETDESQIHDSGKHLKGWIG